VLERLLDTGMQKANIRLDTHHTLAFQFEEEAQHAVRVSKGVADPC